MHQILKITLIFTLLTGCSSEQEEKTSFITHEIAGRDTESSPTRKSLYRVKTPILWERIDAPIGESLVDTKKSIVEFFIRNEKGHIRITIHNFPSDTMESRIPPIAQISRWKQQFSKLNQASVSITSQSFSGFSGLLFEGTGEMNNENITVLGWIMQLAPEHYRILMHPAFPQQAKSDITIKAVGKKEMIELHREEIYAFARSFELIDEIPIKNR